MKRTFIIALAALLILAACAPEEAQTPPSPPESAPAETEPSPPESAPPEEETPAGAAGGGVYTDWSALEPYEPPELLFQRWYEEPVRELRTLDGGYGVLVPYVGSAPPDMSWGGVYEYGLMTMDGTIVVDTAYSDVTRISLREGGETVRLPVLALMTTEPFQDGEGWTRGRQRFGAAALDGSWAVPTQYDGIRAFSPEGFFLWEEGAVHVYGTDGQLRHSIPYANAAALEEHFGGTKLDAGVLTELEGTTLRLIGLDTGESAYVEGVSELLWPGDGLFPVQAADSGLWGCVDRTGAWVVPARYQDTVWPFGDGSGVASVYVDGEERFVDREGNEYSEDPRPQQPQTQPDERDIWIDPIEDSYTGETWYLRSLYHTGQMGYLIEDAQGNVLGNTLVMNDAGSQSKCVVNGLILNIDGETAGYKDREGNWVFRIPLAEAGD